jgi:mono/diheme cytochrome c family protein
MNNLFDVMLGRPLPQEWIKVLLFSTFSFHMLLVLMAVGTAILAFSYFVHAWLKRLDESQWDKTVLRSFLALKSLAVVLGLAPLLLLQVGFPASFFNSISIFAPFWLSVIVLLIVSFLCFDALGHKIYVRPLLHLFLGAVALIFLLAVPGIFVLVVVTAENPDKWVGIIQNGYRLDNTLAVHWLLRYLHIIGAAIIFGAAFHYFFTARGNDVKKISLSRWMMAGILFQFAEGPMLTLSLPRKVDFVVAIFLVAGISAAGYVVWKIFSVVTAKSVPKLYVTLSLLVVTLISMLLIRQHLQNMTFLPLAHNATQNSYIYQQQLKAYQDEALGKYWDDIRVVYDNGRTIYSQSCSFCHGDIANGNGLEAGNLSIPPEDISAIRSTNDYIYDEIVKGIPGTSMPYFTIFDKEKLQRLIAYLDARFHILGMPEPLPVIIPESTLTEAEATYKDICSACHGTDGRGSTNSKALQPQPPDFTRFSLSPARTSEVIRDGYPGTAMPPFQNLPENVRWGLVKILYEKRGIR